MVLPLLTALIACKSTHGSASAEPGSTATPGAKAGNRADTGPTLPANAQKTATTGKLRLVESRAFVSESGFVTIIGEVFNDTGHWVEGVQIDVDLFDAAGKPINVSSIATADGNHEGVVTSRSVIPPGESSPFKYLRDVGKLSRPYKSHKLAARAREASYRRTTAAENIASARDPKLAWWKVTGAVKNTSDRPCRFPEAVIGFYGADGKLIDETSAVPPGEEPKQLAPGASFRFDRGSAFEDPKASVASVKVWGNCAPDW